MLKRDETPRLNMPVNIEDTQYYKAVEITKELGISRTTLWRWRSFLLESVECSTGQVLAYQPLSASIAVPGLRIRDVHRRPSCRIGYQPAALRRTVLPEWKIVKSRNHILAWDTWNAASTLTRTGSYEAAELLHDCLALSG